MATVVSFALAGVATDALRNVEGAAIDRKHAHSFSFEEVADERIERRSKDQILEGGVGKREEERLARRGKDEVLEVGVGKREEERMARRGEDEVLEGGVGKRNEEHVAGGTEEEGFEELMKKMDQKMANVLKDWFGSSC